jgi:hypothetical protein
MSSGISPSAAGRVQPSGTGAGGDISAGACAKGDDRVASAGSCDVVAFDGDVSGHSVFSAGPFATPSITARTMDITPSAPHFSGRHHGVRAVRVAWPLEGNGSGRRGVGFEGSARSTAPNVANRAMCRSALSASTSRRSTTGLPENSRSVRASSSLRARATACRTTPGSWPSRHSPLKTSCNGTSARVGSKFVISVATSEAYRKSA